MNHRHGVVGNSVQHLIFRNANRLSQRMKKLIAKRQREAPVLYLAAWNRRSRPRPNVSRFSFLSGFIDVYARMTLLKLFIFIDAR